MMLDLLEQYTQELADKTEDIFLAGRKLKTKILLVEFACREDSELGKEATVYRWDALRLTRKSHDLRTRSATNEVITAIREAQRQGYFVILFGSIPCTPWTRWHDVNLHMYGPEYRERLEGQKEENLLMVNNFLRVARVVQEDPDHIIAYEWPAYCRGWDNPTVIKMIQELQLREVRLDGCQVGVQTKDGQPILKPWKIMTNSQKLIEALRCKICPRNHVHHPCAGQYTEQTGFYPKKMARIIIKAFAEEIGDQVSRDARNICGHERRRRSFPKAFQKGTGETQTSRC
jgi:hypothetical protein